MKYQEHFLLDCDEVISYVKEKNLFSENITSHRFIHSALIMLTHDISLPAAAVASPCYRT